VATFNGANGNIPASGLVLDAQGNLYGTTLSSGANNSGVIFEIAASTRALTTLASFSGNNAFGPDSGLVLDALGNLYGTRTSGGANNHGDIFELDAATHTLTTLFNFDGTTGDPTAGLVLDAQGNFYGTTSSGGADNGGTVFELSIAVPEPNSLVMVGVGITAVAAARSARRRIAVD